MNFYTLNRSFLKEETIDKFTSGLWTERYYGDSDFQLIVPATVDMFQKLLVGTFVAIDDSKEVMVIDSAVFDKGLLTVSGMSLLPWMNNRFVRASALHEDRYWTPGIDTNPGWVIWAILYYWCIDGEFLNNVYPMGIANPQRLKIPNLSLMSYDATGPSIFPAIPYGPVYDTMKTVATTYEIGMTITLESADANGYSLKFRNYKGADRTSRQNVNPQVRFSPQMDNLTGIKELHSNKESKTVAYSFAPSNPNGMATTPGISDSSASATGFDLKALQTFEDDITTDLVGSDPALLLSMLNDRATLALQDHQFVKTVDGEIVPTSQFKYGVDYTLGDLIEVQGSSGVVSISRVTEYIRAQDEAGEKAYPTVALLE